jgi:hypothetical protein
MSMSSAAISSSRFRLPNRRESTVEDLYFNGERYHLSYSTLDGKVWEVFISGPRAGTDLYAICCTAATLVSLALQHGVPLSTMREAALRDKEGNPVEIVGAVLDVLSASGA